MKTLFGKAGEKQVFANVIENEYLKVTLLNYGATIKSIGVKIGKDVREVALGYDDLQSYIDKSNYFGATIGRVANRISGAKFNMGEKVYTLDKNDGNNCLHGGNNGFDRQVFDVEEIENGVIYTLTSPDGDGGFPAALTLKVEYKLEGNALNISYTASCDGDTFWNPTNHTFFNLAGKPEKVYDTYLRINAAEYTPVNADLVPTGECRKVEGTVFDFTSYKKIGADICRDDEQLNLVSGGYDHNFVLTGNLAASAKYDGLRLDVYTDLPGVQLYTANFLDGAKCSNGVYGKHCAFCLEPQFFPNAINTSGFEKPFLSRRRPLTHVIRYEFSSI